MFELYDALIDGVSEDAIVDYMVTGYDMSLIVSGNSAGVAPYRSYTQRAPLMSDEKTGKPLKEVCECVKSWNFIEASIGNAALCAYYNSPESVAKAGIDIPKKDRVEGRLKDPFINSQNEIKGKKVSIVGHFPFIEELLSPKCELNIIEWEPLEGDFPYSACDYLLPESDFIFLTCAAIGDKSLPHLLELSENAKKLTIVGPGTPLSPVFFEYGVNDISGLIIHDIDLAKRVVGGSEYKRIYAAGTKVNYLSP